MRNAEDRDDPAGAWLGRDAIRLFNPSQSRCGRPQSQKLTACSSERYSPNRIAVRLLFKRDFDWCWIREPSYGASKLRDQVFQTVPTPIDKSRIELRGRPVMRRNSRLSAQGRGDPYDLRGALQHTTAPVMVRTRRLEICSRA
jgi:hypothetical protein